MMANKKLAVWLFFIGLVGGIAIGRVFVLPKAAQEARATPMETPVVQSVSVVQVQNQEIPVYYSGIGSVISDDRIQITSRITGYIDDIRVREGQRIHKGELLISLDSTDIDGAIRQADAGVKKARSALKDAQIDFERYGILLKEGSVPENTLRKMRLKRDVCRETLNAARAALKTAKSQRQYIHIKSPVDGVVVAREKRVGDLATPGFPIISIEARKALLFKTFIPESQIQKLGIGDGVIVLIDSVDKKLDGQILRIVPSGDPTTRSYEVKISINDTSRLLPGMFGRVRFQVGVEAMPVLPRTAVTDRGGLKGVFVVDNDHRTRFRWLRFGREWPNRLQVQAGVTPGERIVISDLSHVHDCDLINIEAATDKSGGMLNE